MTKQIDLLSTETKSITTNSKTSNKEVKQEASLFDKLLGGAVKNSSNEKVDTPLPSLTTDKEQSKSSVNNTNTVSSKIEIVDLKNDINSVPQKSPSLLDRLVLEAKKDVLKSPQNSQLGQTTQNTQNIKDIEATSTIKSQQSTKSSESINILQTNKDSEETNIKTELKTNETVKIVEDKEEIKNSDVIKKDETKSLETAKINKDSEETNIKTELKTNKTVKIVENKEEIKNSDVVKKDETKSLETPKINQETSTIQRADTNKDSEETNIKTELKTNEIVKIVENKEEIKNSDVIKKDETKSLETPKINQETTTIQRTDTNKDSEETNIKIVENKEEIKNSDVIKKDETKSLETPKINQQSQQVSSVLTTQTAQSEEVIETGKVQDVNINSEKINIKTELKTNENNNTNLGKDLASLKKENSVNEKINITKDEIDSLATKQKEEPKSLMDSLIEKTKTLKNQTSLSEEESKTLKNSTAANNSKDILNNIYLSSQRNIINNSALSNKIEAINSVKNATTTEEVEVNAKKLDLNLKDISFESKAAEVKNDTINLIDRKNSLDKIILNNNARHNEVTNLITKSVEASKAILEDSLDIDNEVTLSVNPVLAQNIQSKIIGARQQMSSMMSEVARQMYENYKPPVTAFRINLTPGALGNIAIVMKNDKDSGINISLNISNSATLDAFVDSQNSLRNALNKTFEEGTEFNLDFSSGEQNNNKSDEREDTNQAFRNQSDTQSILESREKNLESEDRNIDYM